MGGEGFEPPKANAGRFTACILWPLGYPPVMGRILYSALRAFQGRHRIGRHQRIMADQAQKTGARAGTFRSNACG